jgi:DnaJ-class molecular chaperone
VFSVVRNKDLLNAILRLWKLDFGVKMAGKDYYKILGISKTATEDEIKKANRKLAMKYHPDRNKNDKSAEARYKDISEAYALLRKRKRKCPV